MVVYHHVNAFEDDGHVIFDVIAYSDNKLYDMFYLKQNSEASVYSKPSYKRFALPIQPHKVGIFFQECNEIISTYREDISLTWNNVRTGYAGHCNQRQPGES